MTEQRRPAVAVRGLVRSKRDNRLAFVFRMRAHTPIYRKRWSLPGGKVEPGQSPEEALKAELLQELGITVKLQDLEPVHSMQRAAHDETGPRLDLFYRVAEYEGEIHNGEPEVHNAVAGFDLDELPADDVVPHELYALSAIVRGERESKLDDVWLTTNGYHPTKPMSAIEEEGVSA